MPGRELRLVMTAPHTNDDPDGAHLSRMQLLKFGHRNFLCTPWGGCDFVGDAALGDADRWQPREINCLRLLRFQPASIPDQTQVKTCGRELRDPWTVRGPVLDSE